MFYPELSMIVNELFSLELIEELDAWFASLPKAYKDKITASKLSIKFDLDFNVATILLDKCCEIGLLEKKFAISCPTCEMILKISNEESLYDNISNIDHCYNCENTNLGFTSDDILIIYRLIKKPTNTPDKIKFIAKKLTDSKNGNIDNDNLTNHILNCGFNPNSFFYNPTEEEQNVLKKLLAKLTSSFNTTTEKGNALEELAEYLLGLVKVFKVSRTIRSSTNQFDVVIRNKVLIPSSILSIIGTHSIIECKNETKKPDNTYYHKLISILQKSSSKFGIVFSLLPTTSTCDTIARETFLLDKIIVINICEELLSEIINKNLNILDVIESKALQITLNSSKDLLETGLF